MFKSRLSLDSWGDVLVLHSRFVDWFACVNMAMSTFRILPRTKDASSSQSAPNEFHRPAHKVSWKPFSTILFAQLDQCVICVVPSRRSTCNPRKLAGSMCRHSHRFDRMWGNRERLHLTLSRTRPMCTGSRNHCLGMRYLRPLQLALCPKI